MKRALPLLLLAACAPPVIVDAGDAGDDAGPALPTFFDADGGPDAGPLLPALPEELEVIDLGVVPATNGETPTFALDLPEGADAFTLFAYGHAGHHVVLASLVAPDGEVWVSPEPPDDLGQDQRTIARGFPGPFFSRNRVVASEREGAARVPSTPDLALIPGRWAARLQVAERSFNGDGFVATPVDDALRVVVAIQPAPDPAPVLDLALYLTGAGALTVDTASDDTDLQAALDEVEARLADANITLGEVHLREIDPALQTVALEDPTCDAGDLDTLMAATDPALKSALPLFLIDRFECVVFGGVDIGAGIGGLAGGIPGMERTAGTLHGGVAIALGPFAGEPARLGRVMVHEMAHFLGLFHLVEDARFGGPLTVDPIADTTEDPDEARDNLMHFLAEGDALTAGQGTQLRRSLLMKEAP